MKNTILKTGLLICVGLVIAGPVLAQNVPQIETLAATEVQNGSATLNGQINYLGEPFITIYFQWGAGVGYDNQTPALTQSHIGNFSQTISGLSSNVNYHYRLVA